MNCLIFPISVFKEGLLNTFVLKTDIGNMKTRKTYNTIKTAAIVISLFVALGAAGSCKSQTSKTRQFENGDLLIEDSSDLGIGNVKVSTLKVDDNINITRASYSFSGRVLITCKEGSDTIIYSLNDDGSDLREIYRGKAEGASRLLPYWDNTRILMGDCVLECPEGYNLDNCPKNSAKLIPIVFPEEFVDGPNVMDKWTEVIISPDNEHIAWTIRRTDCGAVNAMGRLVRNEDNYEILDAKYISNMNAFKPDPEHDGYSLYSPVIGGEVKQFVQGGKAISLVGADPSGMGDSVVQDVATGEVTQITFNPGYDETTIFSPDEKLGIVMTTRFSENTNMAILGIVPRPYGEVLHNILGQVYLYSVTGVRRSRNGNIGPALINIEKSKTVDGYTGMNLSDPDNIWVYHSPMSWKSDGTAAMWMERQRGGNSLRVRIVKLMDYKPGSAVAAVPVPEVGDYAQEPGKLGSYDVKVLGDVSGFVTVRKETDARDNATVTVVYDNYSDDGKLYYNGTESSSGSIMSATSYSSDLVVTDANGKKLGGMDVELALSAAYSPESRGITGPELDKNASRGSAFWGDLEKKAEDLEP